jgi:hypothetical protein
MYKSYFRTFLFLQLFGWFLSTPATAQERKGAITGSVSDTAHAVLQGARVELQPKGQSVASDGQGQFTISDLPAGEYTLTISYVGLFSFQAGHHHGWRGDTPGCGSSGCVRDTGNHCDGGATPGRGRSP